MFTNLQVYRLAQNWACSIEDLEQQLERLRFIECPSNQPSSRGWVNSSKESGLVLSQGKQWLLTLMHQERLLPGDVVKEAVQKRIQEIEDKERRSPGRKEKREIKERVVEELLPTAFLRSRKTQVWIDPVDRWLVINAATPAKADLVLESLRQSLDIFPAKPLHTNQSPQSGMAGWLSANEAPGAMTIDRNCELAEVGESQGKIKYTNITLDHEEIKGHLSEGKLPVSLAMTWDDRLSFILTHQMSIKKLTYLDIIKEEADQNADAAGILSDFALMTGELRRLLPVLVDALGGEVTENA
ncbi:recombination-associated protein RdgC [Azonexus hydrophilus]|uniref:Recombination-associated protein RdgC n=1 Tax=Azonexus hydrophilus TaxID=418702 RepID=A0ABZ2XLQ2_9RHOO